MIYTGRTIHGAGHNATAAPRVALNLAFNVACLKQEENQFLSCPPSIARSLPPLLQEVLGYQGRSALTSKRLLTLSHSSHVPAGKVPGITEIHPLCTGALCVAI